MEPISIIFAKFNFAIWGQNCRNKFHEYFLYLKFLPAKTSTSYSKTILEQEKLMA